ncbi:hypothetical protein QJS04_geneDACA018648 [Acorus gramineus]|uniref:Uncharacterized protein n=1 Tax=Acorus gramineus TaxID=55184 RepID=A0AAV9AGT4_ACOGR|nr:hypothetical protein QJS04_geneDACA018648 [Acorus gramineus]
MKRASIGAFAATPHKFHAIPATPYQFQLIETLNMHICIIIIIKKKRLVRAFCQTHQLHKMKHKKKEPHHSIGGEQ